MKVKDLKADLEFYDDNTEVTFELDDDVDVESWTETKYGTKSVHIDSQLIADFICETSGKMNIMLVVNDYE